MDDRRGPTVSAAGVCVVQCGQQTVHHVYGECRGKSEADASRLGDDLFEVASIDVFHREDQLIAVAIKVEDRNDVRVVQYGGDARLGLKHLYELFVAAELGANALETYSLCKSGGAGDLGFENLRHAALCDEAADAIFSPLADDRIHLEFYKGTVRETLLDNMEGVPRTMEDLLRKRRSIRRYTDRDIEKPVLSGILKAALLSPTSRNLRPWTFVVVDAPELIAALAKAKPHGSGFLKTAKVAIVVTADPSVCDVWVEDTSTASAVLLFAAEAAGLGACWCQIRLRAHDSATSAESYVRGLIGIPAHISVASIIGLGYADETIPPYEDADLRFDKLRYNGFDTPYRFDNRD